jgi:hypothetical protein
MRPQPKRVPYSEAGQGYRASVEAALRGWTNADGKHHLCTGNDFRVLSVVHHGTTSWSKLDESLSLRWIAETLGWMPPELCGVPWGDLTDAQQKRLRGITTHVSRSLRQLDAAGRTHLLRQPAGHRLWLGRTDFG